SFFPYTTLFRSVHATFERLQWRRNVVQFGVHRRRYTLPQLLQRSAQRRKATVELLDGGIEAELGVDGLLLEGGQALFEGGVALAERRQPWFGVGKRRGGGQRQPGGQQVDERDGEQGTAEGGDGNGAPGHGEAGLRTRWA